MRTTALRIILVVVIFTTLVLGVVCYLSGELALKAGRLIYGATLSELTPQIDYVLKMLGSSLIALGILNVLAFARPARYRHIVYVDGVMALLRGLQRILFAGTIHQAFGAPLGRIYTNAAVMLIAAALLFILAPAARDG